MSSIFKKKRRIVKLITKKLVLFKSSISVIVVLYPFIATVNKAFSVQVLTHYKISTLTTQTLIFLFVFLSSYWYWICIDPRNVMKRKALMWLYIYPLSNHRHVNYCTKYNTIDKIYILVSEATATKQDHVH